MLLPSGLSSFLAVAWAVLFVFLGHLTPKFDARHIFKQQQLLLRWQGSGGGGRGPEVALGHWKSLLREKAQAAAWPRSSSVTPMLWHPHPNPVSLPRDKETWLQSWGQNMSQRPDLTPTLESTGSGALMGEGLSSNQTNKPKANCLPQPYCLIITP